MRTPDSGYVSSILAAAESPCVSIYVPTHRANGNANGSLTDQQNHARYRALADRAAEILTKSHPQVARDLADRLAKLRNDTTFWGGIQDGAVVLASPQRLDAFTLPRPVPEYVSVSDTFHVKPLLRFVQSAEPFHVLCLSRERVALFAGNRYELQPLKAPGVPLTLTESLKTEVEANPGGPESTTRPNARTGGEESHGHLVGESQATRKIDAYPDAERFFRDVDREVTHRVSEPSGLSIIPVGVDENLAAFRQLTKNRFVTPEGVSGDWTKWTLHEIREKAWKVFEKHYLARLKQIREDFGTAAARSQATDDLAEAAKAAMTGRVGILLIDADRTIPGSIDMNTGALHPDGGNAAAGDMLDDLAELGLRTKAKVIVTPSNQMPTKTGLAAIFRY